MDVIYTVIFLVLFVIVLIFLSGWFSGSETALTNLSSADVARMKREKWGNVKYIVKLKRKMDRTLITILIGNNVVNIVLSSVTALIANQLFAELGVSVIIGIITFLVIVFGEISPKNRAIIDSKKVSSRNSMLIYYLSVILSPLIWLFKKISKIIIRIMGRKPEDSLLLASDESIKDLVDLSEEQGIIKPIEREIIHKVFAFGDRKIDQIMVPMNKVFNLHGDMSVVKAKKAIKDRGFTRVPVIDKKGKILGILYSKDLLNVSRGRIRGRWRRPFVVSAESDITEVFEVMKRLRFHIAVVRDKKGAHVGIVTLEDILEELVGEIYDEFYEKKYAGKVLIKDSVKKTAGV